MGRKPRVLLIDDNREIVRTLKAILAQKYDVLTAYNGCDGLRTLEAHSRSIELVISDLIMPDVCGIGVISIVKKKYPGLPVIAITGWFDESVTTRADQLLKKPFDIDDLEQSMAELLADRGSQPITQTDLH